MKGHSALTFRQSFSMALGVWSKQLTYSTDRTQFLVPFTHLDNCLVITAG